jgi:hypothetical protein
MYLQYLVIFFIIFIYMHLASHLGPRDDRASDGANHKVQSVDDPRKDGHNQWILAKRVSPSKHCLSVKLKASPGLCITCYYAILLHLMIVGLIVHLGVGIA